MYRLYVLCGYFPWSFHQFNPCNPNLKFKHPASKLEKIYLQFIRYFVIHWKRIIYIYAKQLYNITQHL